MSCLLLMSELTIQQMTLEEGHKLALTTLKQVMEEKLDENNVQLAQVSSCIPSLRVIVRAKLIR